MLLIDKSRKLKCIFVKGLYIAIKNEIYFLHIAGILHRKCLANQPVDWQLGFQKAASESMRDSSFS